QRWNAKRVLLTVALVFAALLAVQAMYGLFSPAELDVVTAPNCGKNNLMILMAQSVPSATQVPCIASLPAGWETGTVNVHDGESTFALSLGHRTAVKVTLAAPSDCSVGDAVEVPSDEAGMRRFERPEQLPPAL